MSDVLGVTPVEVDGAKEATCDIITDATPHLFSSSKACLHLRTIATIEPFSHCDFQSARVVTARIVCS